MTLSETKGILTLKQELGAIVKEYVNQHFVAVTNKAKQHRRGKVCSGLSFRGSVSGQPTQLLWFQCEAEHHGGRMWWRKAGQNMATEKQKKGKPPRTIRIFKGMPPEIYFSCHTLPAYSYHSVQ